LTGCVFSHSRSRESYWTLPRCAVQLQYPEYKTVAEHCWYKRENVCWRQFRAVRYRPS